VGWQVPKGTPSWAWASTREKQRVRLTVDDGTIPLNSPRARRPRVAGSERGAAAVDAKEWQRTLGEEGYKRKGESYPKGLTR